METPDVHPPRDETIIMSSDELISEQSSEPSNGRRELLLDLNTLEGESEANDQEILLKKRKRDKDESVSTNGFRNNKQISVEPILASLPLPGSNTKNGTHKQGDPSTPPQKEFFHGLSSKSETDGRATLILMSCINCYLHVMVCDDNPKCPKCKKGDCLLDMFRGSPVKKAMTA